MATIYKGAILPLLTYGAPVWNSGVAIFKGSEMVAKLMLKLDDRCSNNQAEQLAILKALEAIESMNRHIINPRMAIIFTDNRVSLD